MRLHLLSLHKDCGSPAPVQAMRLASRRSAGSVNGETVTSSSRPYASLRAPSGSKEGCHSCKPRTCKQMVAPSSTRGGSSFKPRIELKTCRRDLTEASICSRGRCKVSSEANSATRHERTVKFPDAQVLLRTTWHWAVNPAACTASLWMHGKLVESMLSVALASFSCLEARLDS